MSMNVSGIPFIYFRSYNDSEFNKSDASGIRLALIKDGHSGSKYTGLMISGITNYCSSTEAPYESNFSGVQVSSIANLVRDEFSGVQTGLVNVAGDMKRFSLQAGLVNYADYIDDDNKGLYFQIGLVNIIDDEPPTCGTTVQIGLYNRSLNQWSPGINIAGISNLFKKKSGDGK